jgi:hypothetical protein
MIRAYLDSNIFQVIKESHPYHQPGLRVAIDNLKDKLLYCFSDAHLADLKNSEKPIGISTLSLWGIMYKTITLPLI